MYVFRWWIIFFISGIVFLPLAGIIFSSFLDKGYGFSKILGILIISYLVFVLGIFKITPFTNYSIYLIFTFTIIPILVWKGKSYKSLLNHKRIFLFIFEECIFFLCLLSWSYVRAFNPEIYGLEKYMDFGFVNSILRSTYFPPVDMWYSGLPINYYYFGHFITAVLTKASGIPSFITYNLMIATLFALCFLESFSLGITLIARSFNKIEKQIFRIIVGGLITASLVSLSGNLHILYIFFKPYDVEKPMPIWNLELSLVNPCYGKDSYEKISTSGSKEIVYCNEVDKKKLTAVPNNYWYPNATRFIHNTIHEFPIYSWVVADLHGHVADIPIVLLTISTIFVIFFTDPKSRMKPIVSGLVFISFLLSSMYMTNAWDGLTYLLLTALVLFYYHYNRVFRKTSEEYVTKQTKDELSLKINWGNGLSSQLKKPIVNFGIGLLVQLSILLFTFFLFSRPFSFNFDASKLVGGIGVVGAPSIFLTQETVDMSGKTYGIDNRNLIKKIFVPDHCLSLMNTKDSQKVTTKYTSRKIGPLLFEPDHCLRSPLWQLLTLYGFFYFFIFTFLVFFLKNKPLKKTDKFILLLIIISTFLIIIPEFIYMKDIYPDHYRANTMFKLVFQAFIMLSIVSGYVITRTSSKYNLRLLPIPIKPLYLAYVFLSATLISLVLIYPYFAVISYYNGLKTYVGLDGVKYLKNRSSGDYEAYLWLNNLKNQPVILEAQGDSYTDYERFSANTGLPTVLGWYVHQWLWRGQDAPNSRTDDIRQIYESEDLLITKELLQKYNISYVIIGRLEREKYPLLKESKLQSIGKTVFKSEDTFILKIHK